MVTITEKGKTYECREMTFTMFDGKPFIKTGESIVALAICPFDGKKVGITLGQSYTYGGVKKMKAGCDAWCFCGSKFYANQMDLDGTGLKYWCRAKLQVGAVQ